MQTSRQVITNAIEFGTPDRLPVISAVKEESDVQWVKWNYFSPGADVSAGVVYDDWQCGWQKSEVANMGLVTVHPLLDWADYDTYEFPNPNEDRFYEGMEAKLAQSGDKYVTTSIFMLLFERLHSLRGFENTLTDLYLEPEKLGRLADRIVDFNIAIIENIARRFPGKVHALDSTDDWGTELDLFISPEMWREFFKPRYKKIFDACHKVGWHAWMHSCGKVDSIILDLADAGLNVINLQQPAVFDIEEVGKRCAGKICFETLCDIQCTLPLNDEEKINKEAKLIIDNWGTDKGGLIFSHYSDYAGINVGEEAQRKMHDAFLRHDRWRK